MKESFIETEIVDLKQLGNMVEELMAMLGYDGHDEEAYLRKWKELLSFVAQKTDDLEEIII